MKNWLGKNRKLIALSLASLLLGAKAVASEVVLLGERRCVDIFTSQRLKTVATAKPGEIISLSSQIPEFQEPEAFVATMETNGDGATYFYNSTNIKPPISKYVAGAWSPQPYIAINKEIFILKAIRIPRFMDSGYDQSLYRIEEIRQSFKLASYTKVAVPPIFALLNRAIYFVRAMESHLGGEAYSNVGLDYQLVVKRGPLAERLLQFVDSWVPRDQVEEVVKKFLSSMVEHHYKNAAQGEVDVDTITRELQLELMYLYPPEFVDSLMNSLYTFR